METEPETTDDPEDAEEEDGNNPEGFEWGNGNGEVPPGQNVDEDGNIVNDGGHMPPGLNRGEKPDKGDNPNPPEVTRRKYRKTRERKISLTAKRIRARISTPTTS